MHDDRNYLAQYVDLIDVQTNTELGYVCDVSETGLMFITERTIVINEVKNVYIQNKIFSPQIPTFSIQATIKILWSKASLNPELSCIGCSILAIEKAEYDLCKLANNLSYNHDVQINRVQE